MIRWFIAGGLLKKWRGFGIAHAFPDANNIIRHPDVDLVVVLPPTPQHAALVRAAIAGGKDLYCEWPQLRVQKRVHRDELPSNRRQSARTEVAPDCDCAQVHIGVSSSRISPSLPTSRPSRSWNGESRYSAEVSEAGALKLCCRPGKNE
jgi:hypothetical protein